MSLALSAAAGFFAAAVRGIYHIAVKQKLVGIVYNQPDEASAIKAAVEEYNVPPNERGR
jgi:hypothetical protein